MSRLPRWLRRAIAIDLVIVVAVIVALGIVQPTVTAYSETREALAQAHEMLARYHAVVSERDGVERQVEALRERQAESGTFAAGESDSLATAGLQDHLQTIVGNAGGDLRSIRTLPSEGLGGVTRISISTQIVADVRAVRQLLYELETGTPLLFVERMQLRGRLQRGEDDEPEVTPELLVELVVSGYRLGETA